MRNNRYFGRGLGLGAIVLMLGACGEDRSVVAGPSFNVVPFAGYVSLCKNGPEGTTATFEISATSGTFPMGNTVTLEAVPPGGTCQFNVIWQPTETGLVDVTVTEVGATGNVQLVQIAVSSELDGLYEVSLSPPTVTVRGGDAHKVAVRFKNEEGPPQDGEGSAGCTPGFWKQPHHYEFWTAPYTPSTLFGSVFANAFPEQSLVQVVAQGGGGLNALGRHTVAALLNAASPDVDYGMSAASVIAAFNAAFASGEYEELKDLFEARNERGCTAKD